MSTEHPDTPNIPSASAILRIQSSTLIDVPIQQVWNALTDTSTWPSWNKFVPRVTIREQPDNNNDSPILRLGSRFTFHVNMDSSSPPGKLRDVLLTVIEASPPDTNTDTVSAETGERKGRIVWANDAPAQGYLMSLLLTAERVHELSEVEVEVDGEVKTMTEVRNWESQVGYLAYVVRWMLEGVLRKNFEVWSGGLKGYSERGSG